MVFYLAYVFLFLIFAIENPRSVLRKMFWYCASILPSIIIPFSKSYDHRVCIIWKLFSRLAVRIGWLVSVWYGRLEVFNLLISIYSMYLFICFLLSLLLFINIVNFISVWCCRGCCLLVFFIHFIVVILCFLSILLSVMNTLLLMLPVFLSTLLFIAIITL